MKSFIIIIFSLTLAFLPADIYAQGGVQEAWVARYDGPAGMDDAARALGIDGNGNVYVTGESVGANQDNDYATIKYAPDGTLLWVQRYDSAGTNNARALVVDAAGAVYVTGSSPAVFPSTDMVTIKYTADGTQFWIKHYDWMQSKDDGLAMAMDAQGDVYAVGQSIGSGGGGFDFLIVKYNSLGGQEWEAHYNGPGNNLDGALAVVAKLPYVYITGNSTGAGTGSDFATIKYDASLGTELWVRRYNGPANYTDIGRALAVDAQNNIYVTGESMGIGSNLDYFTIKYDANGDSLWTARYNGPGNGSDMAVDLKLDSLGNVYVTGVSVDANNISAFTTLKYDSDGNLIWEARFDGSDHLGGGATAMTLDPQGNIYVTGTSASAGGGSDYTTLKYDPDGNELWTIRYSGPGNLTDVSVAIAVDAQGEVVVTGRSMDASGEFDFATVKYTQSVTGVTQSGTEIMPTFQLQQNYPNPFNPVTNIKFASRNVQWVTLKVYDIQGRRVKTLVNERKAAGTYTVQWDGTNDAGEPVASGVYFYRLSISPLEGGLRGVLPSRRESRGVSQTRKMVLLR